MFRGFPPLRRLFFQRDCTIEVPGIAAGEPIVCILVCTNTVWNCHDRTQEIGGFAQSGNTQDHPKNRTKDKRTKGSAQALVTTRDPGEQRARSGAGRLHADRSEEDRGLAQALGGTQFAPQGRRLSLGAFNADLLHQPCRQDLAKDATATTGAGQDGAEAAVWQGQAIEAR
jgi:hypothetical protein